MRLVGESKELEGRILVIGLHVPVHVERWLLPCSSLRLHFCVCTYVEYTYVVDVGDVSSKGQVGCVVAVGKKRRGGDI